MAKELRRDWHTYVRIAQYLRGKGWYFIVAIWAYLLAAGGEVFFAWTLGAVVDTFNPPPVSVGEGTHGWWPRSLVSVAVPPTILFPCFIFGAGFVRAIGTITGEYLLSRVSFHVVHSVRCDLYNRLLELPSSYFDWNSHGSLSNRLTDTTSKLRDTATDVQKIAIQDGVKLITLLIAMILTNAALTMLFLIIGPIVAVIVRFASKRFRSISRKIQTSMGAVTHVGQEAVSAHRIIRAYGGEEYERNRFSTASEINRKQHLKLVATKAFSTQFIQLLVAIALGLLVGVLFIPEISGSMSTGELVTYIGWAGLLANPIKRLSDVNARLQTGLAAAEEIFDQIDHEKEPDTGSIPIKRAHGDLEFKDVFMRYENATSDALSGVSFRISRGETVALVGTSGGGKSTIAGLLFRFYSPSSGEVLLDGRNMADYCLRDLRAQIALVDQDVVLFNDSLRNNIAYGSLNGASDDAIQTAIKRARADVFVDQFVEGLDTQVGNLGSQLSAGQRQRVAIARALLKDAPVLILDEATSALDTESESLIQAALDEAMRDRTTLVIAHRLSTVESADRIFVVENGTIAETGTHQELLDKDSRYAQLYRYQFKDLHSAKNSENTKSVDSVITIVDQPSTTLVKAWYSKRRWIRWLTPLAWLFGKLVERRRRAYANGKKKTWRADVPVVVVGNITVGGTGKTPLVIWLTRWLTRRGKSVGILSRGHSGRACYPLEVHAGTDISRAGDEAPMLAVRTGCPVVVDPNRVRGAKYLTGTFDVDLVIADDGMQHYALERDLEIAVVDGMRGIGNGRMLPAGPLREPVSRLRTVDWVVSNGGKTGLIGDESLMRAVANNFVNIITNERLSASEFVRTHSGMVYAFAAVGNPFRFERTLKELGLEISLRAFSDHYELTREDLYVPSDAVVVVTEKDARKLQGMSLRLDEQWYLEIDIEFDESVDQRLTDLFASRGINLGELM